MKRTTLLGLTLLASQVAFADLADDLRAGTNFHFDIVGLNYSYSGASSGGGIVLDDDAPASCVAKNPNTYDFVLTGAALGLPFNINIPMTGSKLSPTRVRWTSDTQPNITVTVNVGGTPTNVLIRRVWGQLTQNLTSEPLFRDVLCSQGYNLKMEDTASNTDSWVNVEAYAFGIVSPLFRIDYIARDIDNIGFGGVPRGTLYPDNYNIVSGTPFGGDLTSLREDDDNPLYILCDESAPSGVLEVKSTSAADAPSQLVVETKCSSTHPAMIQFLDVRNYTTSTWELNTTAPVGSSEISMNATINAPANHYIQAGTREISMRIRWIPSEDLVAEDGWSNVVDRAVWQSVP